MMIFDRLFHESCHIGVNYHLSANASHTRLKKLTYEAIMSNLDSSLEDGLPRETLRLC